MGDNIFRRCGSVTKYLEWEGPDLGSVYYTTTYICYKILQRVESQDEWQYAQVSSTARPFLYH